jgi:carbamoyltransferase
MKILGLSFFYHDAAACLLIDGVPVAMSEEERFSRKKHDSRYPELAIDFVLSEGNIRPQDLDAVVFYEKPFIKFDRILKTSLSTFPYAPLVFVESIRHTFIDKLWVRELIARKLGIPNEKVKFSGHHLSHAASAFYPSGFKEAAILTVDGVGEWTTMSLAEGKADGTIRVLKTIDFPHSLGLLYSAFTAFLGFEVNEGEYKVMGMAPYGTPRYADKVRELLTVYEDGSFELKLKYFAFHRSLSKSYTHAFVDLFGAPRDPASKFFTRTTGWPVYFGAKPEGEEYERLALEQEHYADIAASVQVVLEEVLVKIAKHLRTLVPHDTLCLAGGVALNSVANWKIRQQAGFTKVFVQPAAGDGGGSYGAALAYAHSVNKEERRSPLEHAYYGKEYSAEEIDAVLTRRNIASKRYDDSAELADIVSGYIADGKVIGWYQGRFEWGPRALGNRSILADPRRVEMKDVVNTKIKFREPYRPFAPSVLAEYAEEYFDMPDAMHESPARYMLYVAQVKKEKQSVVPAITHVDGSARPQLVFKGASPRYWALINSFREKTGVALLMNTSYNLRGEPIVTTPDNALDTFYKSEMDVCVLGPYIVLRTPS